jgi:hypothetical protein
MTKKSKISLNSSLIDLVTEKTIAVQEQGYVKDKILSGDYNPDSPNYQIQSNFDKKQREAVKKAFNQFWNECEEYREKAKRQARRIVRMEFEDWTQADTDFYNKYKNEGSPPCTMLNKRDWTMDQWIEWVEQGEKGMCDNPWHCILPVAEVAALFIPYVGWAVSIGLGMIDAAIYWNEGDKETAGLVGFLTLLPGVGKVVKKFPFVKSWGKNGAKKIALKISNNKPLNMLERYQLKALGESTEFIEKAVTKHVQKEISEKITKESIEKFTAKQKAWLKEFATITTVFIGAGLTYKEIYGKVAETGVLGPKDLIRNLWGIEPRDKATQKVNKFFLKVTDPDAEPFMDVETEWDFIKFIFNSSGNKKDGELMVQAIKNGWNPYEEGKAIVPKKYRTKDYKNWVNSILSNKVLIEWFGSDGSEQDNNLLLSLVFENPSFSEFESIPEKYQTETYKKKKEEREKLEKSDDWVDDENDIGDSLEDFLDSLDD